MFQPVIISSGLTGWRFLEATMDRQMENFAKSPRIASDRAYLEEKLSQPLTQEAFLDDRRLLRVAMTAVGLEGEEWKRGFIDKVLTEAADPESTFLARLNNPAYTEFAEIFVPVNGSVTPTPERVSDLGRRFEAASFRIAAGETDSSMRLSLDYQARIADVARPGRSEDAVVFRLLADVPMRTVLEGALNLPGEFVKLPIESQSELLKTGLRTKLGVSDVSKLADPQLVDRTLERFHAVNALNASPAAAPSGSVALALLGGVGATASQNLFLSSFL